MEKLQEHCEWSESVRRTKLQMLGTKLKNLRMKENEITSSYSEGLVRLQVGHTLMGNWLPISG